MWNGVDTLYGNEWIDYDQSYFKIMIAEDGMYRLSKSALESAGVPANSINGGRYQLFYMGKEIPIHVTTDLSFTTNDYIEFYGQRNRGELDRHLYTNPETDMLNPEYSLTSDSSAYFLTWVPEGSSVKRYNDSANDLNNLPSAEVFYIQRNLVNLFETNIKNSDANDVAESTFDQGEGFGSTFKVLHEIEMNASNVYTAGGDAKVTVRLTTDNGSHELSLSFNDTEQETDSPSGFGLKEYEFEIPSSQLLENNMLKVESLIDEFDRTSVSNAWLTYPRSFNFSGENQFVFTIKAGSSAKYLEIENFNAEGQSPVLYDITNELRIVTTVDNGVIKIKIPASTEDRTLVLSSQLTGYKTATAAATNFVDYTSNDARFIIISNPKLYNDGNGFNYVNEYANYRSSEQGGAHNAIVVDIQQLYDQFSYGINRHFISMRNFGHYVKKEWSNPEYVFIIGKGRDFYQVRTSDQLNNSSTETFAIPTFGSPGADNLLMASGNSNIPIIPIGRIAVSTTDDIKNYLEKVQLMESGGGAQTLEDQLWKKEVLHLGGGSNSTSEPISIKNHLYSMENIIEGNQFGGNVTSFFKSSSDPIQLGDSDGIFNRINNGVSIITFFGHAAVGTFDFNIENPARYENYGKYPILFSLGCYSGNIHTSSRGISERFLFLKDKGVVAFGASTGQGYISSLSTFAKEYYNLIGEEYYGETIGKVLQETIRSLSDNLGVPMITLKQQFTLHGDPALRLYPSNGADYIVDSESVGFEPSVLTANLDSITVNFSIANLGHYVNDSIYIEIEQELPNGEIRKIYRKKVMTPRYKTAFSVKTESFKKEAAGQNKLYITIDTDNDINESPNPAGELNNELLNSNGSKGISFYIFDDSAKPVYPKKYGIVNEPTLVLKASTSDGLAPERKYVFEIDTTQYFNSPIKNQTEIISSGGVIRWSPTMSLIEDRVYYWRVSPDSISPEAPYVWENSSFVYLPNEASKGWNQSHYFQYKENPLESITVNENRDFIFPEKLNIFRLKNKIHDTADLPRGFIDNTQWSDFFRWELPHSLTIVVFDTETDHNVFGPLYGNIWFNHDPGEYGSVNTEKPRIGAFPFPVSTQSDRANIINFLENVVPDGARVAVYTALNTPELTYNIDEWAADSLSLGGVNLFNLMESYGATEFRSMESTGEVPYIFVFKKGEEVIFEQKAFDAEGVVDFEMSVPSFLSEGEFRTVSVGPASSWDRIIWDYSDVEAADTIELIVYGISQEDQNQKDSLFTFIEGGEYDISSINIGQYINLELKLFAKDIENQTPVDIDQLTVLYEGVPEVAVSSTLGYTFNKDTLQQGEGGLFEIAVENIGDYNIDSLLLKYKIVDASNNEEIVYKRVAPIEKNGMLNTSFSFESEKLEGNNSFILEINPNHDQPEQYKFNNFAVKPFFVERDKRNPLLDVTFDGVHILDGDIVSPKPSIYISLNDENQYLELADTSLFKMFLKRPGQQVADNIPIDSETVDFYPDSAGDNNNKAAIRYNPVFEEDGVFELLVQAEDATGNQSGALDYKVQFEVITKSSISNILNYPNPFSTATQFVYTLTGEEIPEYFKIQIFTSSGKIVKEITQDEIGPLRVGTHRTDYRWDGTDEYGDRLANGVYLYRIVAKKQGGETYDAFDNGTNSMFKKGFGKLVILR